MQHKYAAANNVERTKCDRNILESKLHLGYFQAYLFNPNSRLEGLEQLSSTRLLDRILECKIQLDTSRLDHPPPFIQGLQNANLVRLPIPAHDGLDHSAKSKNRSRGKQASSGAPHHLIYITLLTHITLLVQKSSTRAYVVLRSIHADIYSPTTLPSHPHFLSADAAFLYADFFVV